VIWNSGLKYTIEKSNRLKAMFLRSKNWKKRDFFWIIYLTLPIPKIYCGVVDFPHSGVSPVISFPASVWSAFGSHPVRWVMTPETARSEYAANRIAEQAVEKTVDPDLGKPRSESGDILDISSAAQISQSDTRMSLEAGKSSVEKTDSLAAPSTTAVPTGSELTPEEQQAVEKLKALDREVRTHEMAHVLAGGAYVTSGPSYTYQTGPDGKGYAVGGSVGIDTSPVEGDPEATIQKMQTVAAAALAPASPSGQDMKVAAAARQAEAKARAELAKVQVEPQEAEEQPENESVSEFSVVRQADRMADASPKSDVADAVMPSLVRTQATGSESSPSSAYKAQAVMTLASPRFSAFA
jgi:hypothetical protein